jgi:adenylate cyclase
MIDRCGISSHCKMKSYAGIVATANIQLNLAQHGVVILRSTENLEAFDDVLRGMKYLVAPTKDDNARARQTFEQAIALDPAYAAAYALLGLSYWVGWALAFDPDPNAVKRGLKPEQQAIALDDSLAGGHGILAEFYSFLGQRYGWDST